MAYSPTRRPVLGKPVPEVLDSAQGRCPRAVLKTEGTIFPNTDRPGLVYGIFFLELSILLVSFMLQTDVFFVIEILHLFGGYKTRLVLAIKKGLHGKYIL